MFVGRDDLLAEILRGTIVDEFRAYDLSGRLGAGKTSILQRLEDHALQRLKDPAPAPRPVRVNLEDFNPGHRGEHGSKASLGAVQGSFQQFSALLEILVQQMCPKDAFDRFKVDVVDARNAEVLGVRVSSLEESMAEFEEALGPQDLANAWRSARAVVADSFVSHWNAATATTRCMLLIDNTDEVADQEIGRWLGELLPQLARTIVVFTRTPEVPLFPLPGHVVRVFEIADFNEGEVRAYLETAARLPGSPRVSDYLARKVYEVSQGHPATLAAVYELLLGSNALPGTDPLELLRDLSKEQPAERAAVLVERLVRLPDDDALKRALWAVAVPRRFDARLLKHLLANPPLSGADQTRVFEALSRFKFTEKLLPDGSVLRLHSYVRNGLFQRMRRNDPDGFDALHASAADHYEQRLTAEGMDGVAYSYGEAFTYEDPSWQRNKREWLYHRGHATSKDAQRNAVLELTRVFLDAFWWWGNYIHFDFCDQLVTDLEHLAGRRVADADEDAWPHQLKDLHQALRRILRGYPLRSMKSKHADADWNEVWNALLEVQRLCDLQARDASRLTKDKRHVAALLLVFLAHTWRYRAPEGPEADDYYSRAADLFAQDEDWSEAWVAFERAELRFERGEADAVPDLWRHAAGLVQPHEVEAASVEVAREVRPAAEKQVEEEVNNLPDDELASNLHRLRGDCCWASGDQARSAMWYGRAVLHAYLFHLVGGPPDDYTLQFYVDIRARALSRLFHVWQQGDKEAAVALATEMARAFPATHGREPGHTPDQLRRLLADGKPVPLAHALFPKGPEVSELGKRSSTFTREHDVLVEALGPQRASGDLHDLAWP